MIGEAYTQLFGKPRARTRVLGELDVSGTLNVADPLVSDDLEIAVEAGRYVVDLAATQGRVASVRGLRKGASPSDHRKVGELVVDTGKASISIHSVAKLTERERERFLSDEPQSIGSPPWMYGCCAGWGDGIYEVFVALEGGHAVGVWIDFAVEDLPEAEVKTLTDAECLELFDALEKAVRERSTLPDLSPLGNRRKRKVHAVLFPRLASLFAQDSPRESVTCLAQTWWTLPGFQQSLARIRLSPARWEALLAEDFFAYEHTTAIELATAVAEDESIPQRVRFLVGEPKKMWPIAVAALDRGDLTFFRRPGARDAAPDDAARDAVIAAVRRIAENEPKRARACAAVIENLRSGNAPRIP